MSKYWLRNCPVRTHFYNGISILFPAWEGLFVDVVKAYLPQVRDEVLQGRMLQFMAQETAHKNAHHAHNKRTGVLDKELLEVGKTSIAAKKPKMKVWLAAMVSIEHIAAGISRHILRNYCIDSGREVALFVWHSKEELEHKSLAVDLWDYLGYPRSELHGTASNNLKYVLRAAHTHMIGELRRDGRMGRVATWLRLAQWYYYALTVIVLPYLSIYAKEFHPDDIDDTRLLLEHP
jgi:predicted metal-dependent hydrolase